MGDEDPAGEQAFTAISHQACPPLAETLLAVVAAGRPVTTATSTGNSTSPARPVRRRVGRPRARRRAGPAADA